MTLASNPSPPAAPTATRRGQIATFLDLIKFAHSIFALPFALIASFWAFQAAHLWPPTAGTWARLALILACMVIARTFAMTFNRLVDRRFDAANPRTAKRPSVTGAVSVPFMHATLLICFLPLPRRHRRLLLPRRQRLASPPRHPRPRLARRLLLHQTLHRPLPLLARHLPRPRPHLRLDRHRSARPRPWDPAGLTILLLGTGVAFWVGGFDILYALQDEDFDRANNLRSIPAALGRKNALAISRLSHLIAALLFLSVGISGHMHALYWSGFAAAVILLLIEQSLVSPRDISKINIAFMTANGLIGLVFGSLAIADMCVWPRTF